MRIYLTGSKYIDVDVCRKNIKNLILKVYTDGSVKLSVPVYISEDEIRSFLNSKVDWINNHLDAQKNFDDLNPRFWYLGNCYDVDVFIRGYERIKFEDNKIIINIKFLQSPFMVFDRWWRKKSEDLYKKYVRKWMQVFSEHGVKRPDISLRKMKTLWGSCTPLKNKIRFNYYLLAAPEECIDYIVLHEMTHLIHPNHGKRFHTFVTTHMPDWQERKKILNADPYIADMQNIEKKLMYYYSK